MKHTLPLIVVALMSCPLSAAVLIYGEDFTAQEGKGASGRAGLDPLVDVGGVSWTVDVSGTALTAADDYFKVDGGELVGRDLDGPAVWISPLLDISSFVNVMFSLEAFEAGDHEASDYFDVHYSIDGGVPVLLANWMGMGDAGHGLIDDWDSAAVSLGGLGGSSLQLRVTMENNAGTEYLKLDNVRVTGDRVAGAVPEGGSILAVFGGVCLAMIGSPGTRGKRRAD